MLLLLKTIERDAGGLAAGRGQGGVWTGHGWLVGAEARHATGQWGWWLDSGQWLDSARHAGVPDVGIIMHARCAGRSPAGVSAAHAVGVPPHSHAGSTCSRYASPTCRCSRHADALHLRCLLPPCSHWLTGRLDSVSQAFMYVDWTQSITHSACMHVCVTYVAGRGRDCLWTRLRPVVG